MKPAAETATVRNLATGAEQPLPPATAVTPLPAPQFFATAVEFRQWLQVNAAAAEALLVGFYKVGSGRPSLSWPESVDEALCFGWIDGVRKRIDEHAYSIRFTPRKPGSIWSAINIAKVESLRKQGRMTAAGLQAFAQRQEHRSGIYSYEQPDTAELTPQEQIEFRRNIEAWRFFEAAAPSYRKTLLHWVTTARKPQTREARLSRLISASAVKLKLR